MKPFLNRILEHFNITELEYSELISSVSRDDFDYGHKFDKMDEVVNFVKSFVEQNKKIVIYGDYDCDGVMSTSILKKMFDYIGYHVDYYLPSRYIDNYGINVKHAQEYIDKKYDLVITVDNGISAFEPIKMLHDAGIAVCVFDHHEMLDKLPECDYLLHPTISNFGNVAASGGFVSFMFSKAFLGRYDKYLATLAAISLVSDTMPLQEYNRKLLKLVIREYTPGEFYALDLLAKGGTFDENCIGMRIAPRINSIGRMLDDISINDLVDFLTTEDEAKILNYFEWIDKVNEDRKFVSRNATGENLQIDKDTKGVVIEVDEKEGVIGLIATHITNEYQKPAIVFTKATEEGVLKGSARTPEGYSVLKIFEALDDLLLTHGGHLHAGGCSIKAEDFEEFKERMIKFVESTPVEVEPKSYVPLLMTDLTFTNLEIIQSLAPYGEGMRSPLFVLPRIRTSALTFSKTGKDIMTQVGTNVRLVGWGISKEEATEYPYIDLIGKMTRNEFRGFVNLQYDIQEIRVSEK